MKGAAPFVTAGGLLAAGLATAPLGWGLVAAPGLLGAAALLLPTGRRLAAPFLVATALAIVWLAARL